MSHVGRNDPCPCGSGKKYKKCCIGQFDAVRDVPADEASGASPCADSGEFESYPFEDDDQDDDQDDWQRLDADAEAEIVSARGTESDFPVFADPPEEKLRGLSRDQDRLVEDWFKATKKPYKDCDADAMLGLLTGFWDLHPELVPHLELDEGFLFELGEELGRRKEWPRYAEVLLRLREEHPGTYAQTFGYFDYDLIIEALAQGRAGDVPRFFDFFHRHPGADCENGGLIASLLAWAGAEEALLEFVKPLRKKPDGAGVSMAADWLLFGLQIPYLAAGADPDEAANGVAEEVRNINLFDVPGVDLGILRNAFDRARKAPSLPNYVGCRSRGDVWDFHTGVMWNFTGFLHRSKGLPWTRAFYLAGRLRCYGWRRAEDARPRTPFSLDLGQFEEFLCGTCRNIIHFDGVRIASAIEAMGHFADYLLACGILGKQEQLDLQDGCRTFYRRALDSYDTTDPVARLLPELRLEG